MTEDEVLAMLRKACDRAGSQQAFAALHEITPAYVSDVLRKKRTLGPAILNALGLEVSSVVSTYRRIRK